MADNKHSVILLDRPELYRALLRRLPDVPFVPSGAGFAQGVSGRIHGRNWHILTVPDENSHRMTWLSIMGFSLHQPIDTVIAVAGARSLVNHLYPGDLALVHTASILPYPALFVNRDPYNEQVQDAVHFRSNPVVMADFGRFLLSNRTDFTWQSEIPCVQCAYLKHPQEGGSLAPWAKEQFQYLREHSVETLADMPAGVYEAQRDLPETRLVSINQIRSTPSPTSQKEWQRHKHRFDEAPLRLLTQFLRNGSICPQA